MMRTRFFSFFPLLLTAALTSQAAAETQHDALNVQVDQYLSHQNQYGRFSGNILIAKENKLIYESSFGMADVKMKRPVTPDSLFKVGSLTQPLTAAAILRLHEQGKLNLDEPVSKYYPKLKKADNITIAMLLNHTSGLFRDNSWREYDSSCKSDQLIKNTINTSADYPPHLIFNYSNANYYLLGGIIEKVTQSTFEEFVTSEVLRPLGMKDSSLKLTLSFQLAKSYELSGLVDAYITPSGCAWAAGELITSARDLMTFSQALQNGELLSPASYTMMLTNEYGLFNEEIEGRQYYLHQGQIDGFKALFLQHPETKTTIVALSNLHNTNIDLLTVDLLRLVDGRDPLHTLKLPESKFATWRKDVDIIGNYLDNSGVPLQVVFEGGILKAKVNQFDIPLQIQSKNSLFALGIDNQIRIYRNENDTTKEIIFFSRDGRYLSRFTRI
ncbi:serine hydrolase domain-containing protein [Photobacterium ganghwense]|uniref:serine hydrolase domain-containing protein n=1 Tax=Photobacterium ganghwense TaxID=320778 RepID=UPI001C2CDA5A|nr:serine hydrolase domain-containing protein [Photobacterium ganghwense]MBV1839753.1 beta-lactamase family protein [Photobacterium ganghwense]